MIIVVLLMCIVFEQMDWSVCVQKLYNETTFCCIGPADPRHRDVQAELGVSVCGWYRLCWDPGESVARAHPSASGQCDGPQQHRAHERVHAGGHWLYLPGHRKSSSHTSALLLCQTCCSHETFSESVRQDPEHLQDNANQILTAIIQGMRKEEPSNNVKLAATNALLNSLEFTKANFDKEVLPHPR